MRKAIGFLLLIATAAAQTSPLKARIEGRLENALTGDPLRKGVLRLRGAASTFRGPQYVADSDNNGNFVFEQVEPGSYVLSADRAGFLRGNYGARFLVNGEIIRLRAGEKKLLRLALSPRSAISGRVLDGDGDPLPSIEVDAWRWRWSAASAQRLLQLVARVTPDDEGAFRLAALPTGHYYLSASSTIPTDTASGVRVLRRKMPDEKLPEGYETTFYPGVLNVEEAKPIDVAVGQEVAGINLRLRRSKLARIRGTVANHYSFLPLNLMTVELTPLDRPTEAFPSGARSQTVQDGSFEFAGVAPGRYSVVARDNSPAEHLAASMDVVVSEKDLDNVRVELRPGADVKCVVRFDRLRNEVHDRPQGAWQSGPVRATVMLRSVDGGASRTVVATQDVSDGPLRLLDIPPGRYWVDVTNLPKDVYVKWIRFGEQDVTATPLKVSQGNSEPALEVMLSDKTATLSGVVLGASGGPVRIAQVMLAPASRELERVSRLVKGTVSGAGGTFRFEGVAPGQYVVLAFEDAEPGLAEDPEFRAEFAGMGTLVNLGPSGDQAIEVNAIPASPAR
jgi:hypothetical protein